MHVKQAWDFWQVPTLSPFFFSSPFPKSKIDPPHENMCLCILSARESFWVFWEVCSFVICSSKMLSPFICHTHRPIELLCCPALVCSPCINRAGPFLFWRVFLLVATYFQRWYRRALATTTVSFSAPTHCLSLLKVDTTNTSDAFTSVWMDIWGVKI